jgi:hypothetical protein
MTTRDDHRQPTGADLLADQLRLGDLGDGDTGMISLPSVATTLYWERRRAMNEGLPADANPFSACRREQVRQPCGGGHADAQAEKDDEDGDEQAN